MGGNDRANLKDDSHVSSDSDVMIRLSHVDKIYRLGEIGYGTLRQDLQSWIAKRRGLPDPNSIIGREHSQSGESFLALKDVNLTVRERECLGVIGGNGAGKSTMLKLISRVTAPTAGEIDLYGRTTSMLEVGAGFHGEMTGRENAYLNGAILGMKKKDIDAVLDQIVEFSEVGEFIDTPVKRYSSGMYVRLAFAVAAHLESEIVVMDEVLAVGDVGFQRKCIQKMLKAAHEEDRTILYVSHNMTTVRELCDRCVVLDHGRIVYDGEVEKAISYYSEQLLQNGAGQQDFTSYVRRSSNLTGTCVVETITLVENTAPMDGLIEFETTIRAKEARTDVVIRLIVSTPGGMIVGMTFSNPFDLPEGRTAVRVQFGVAPITTGVYTCDVVVVEFRNNTETRHDFISKALSFRVEENLRYFGRHWTSRAWGNVKLAPATATKVGGNVVQKEW